MARPIPCWHHNPTRPIGIGDSGATMASCLSHRRKRQPKESCRLLPFSFVQAPYSPTYYPAHHIVYPLPNCYYPHIPAKNHMTPMHARPYTVATVYPTEISDPRGRAAPPRTGPCYSEHQTSTGRSSPTRAPLVLVTLGPKQMTPWRPHVTQSCPFDPDTYAFTPRIANSYTHCTPYHP